MSSPQKMCEIRLNGQSSPTSASTVLELLEELKLLGRPVAVERNREIIFKESYQDTPILPGDAIEIIQCVGGG